MRHRAMDSRSDAGFIAGSTARNHVGRICVCANGYADGAGISANTCSCDVREIVSTNVNFPFQFDGRGRTQDPTQDYVRQMVEQVLFTSPGERVNLPDFGSGLLQLPFAPNSLEMAAATQFSVQAALQKWLSNYIKVQSVVATVKEAVLTVTVSYVLLDTGVSQVQTFVYGGNP